MVGRLGSLRHGSLTGTARREGDPLSRILAARRFVRTANARHARVGDLSVSRIVEGPREALVSTSLPDAKPMALGSGAGQARQTSPASKPGWLRSANR
jgi:hypothetical protein